LKHFGNTLVFWLIAVRSQSMEVTAPSISCYGVKL